MPGLIESIREGFFGGTRSRLRVVLAVIFAAMVALALSVFIVVVVIFIAISDETVEEAIDDALFKPNNIEYSSSGFEWNFPLGFSAKRADFGLDKLGEVELSLIDLSGGVGVFRLAGIGGRAEVAFTDGAGGSFKAVSSSGGALKIEAEQLDIARLLKDAPEWVGGVVDADVSFSSIECLSGRCCPSGLALLEATSIGTGDLAFGTLALFLGESFDVKARLNFKGCKANVEGLWIYGEAINGVATGEVDLSHNITKSKLELRVDITETGATTEAGALLKNFEVAPGRYVFKVGGTLGAPVITK